MSIEAFGLKPKIGREVRMALGDLLSGASMHRNSGHCCLRAAYSSFWISKSPSSSSATSPRRSGACMFPRMAIPCRS